MYNEYQPSLLLAPYIDKYWEFKGNPDYGMKINILPGRLHRFYLHPWRSS